MDLSKYSLGVKFHCTDIFNRGVFSNRRYLDGGSDGSLHGVAPTRGVFIFRRLPAQTLRLHMPIWNVCRMSLLASFRQMCGNSSDFLEV